MLSTLPSYTALRRPSRSARALPPMALAVRVSPRVDTTDPGTLLRRCVAVTAIAHPLLDALLRAAGAQVDRGTYTLEAPATQAPTAAVAAALAATHPGSWRAPAKSTVTETLGQGPVTAMAAAGAAPGSSRPKRLAAMTLRVARHGRRLRLTPTLDHPLGGTHRIGAGVSGRALLTPREALEVIRDARRNGIVVVDADAPGRLSDLEWLVDRGCLVTPIPSAPGWARLTCGDLVAAPADGPLPVGDAVALTHRIRGDVVVAVHDDVATVAAAVEASGTQRPGLRPWQDQFVSAYLASGPGLVNALPPGSGKTVCAASAMAERAARDHTRPYRAVVLAPAGVRIQWTRELPRFFPGVRVAVAETAADVPSVTAAWDRDAGPVVALLTPQMLARTTETFTDLRPDDLVVDEATFLRRTGSEQAAAAWLLRDRSRHAMVLTGTPDPHGADDLAALVAFARGRRDLFADHPLSQPHPDVATDRLGPLLYRGPHDGIGELPTAKPHAVPVPVEHAEMVVEKLARERVAALLAAATGPAARRSAPRLRTELEAWRLGLTCPAALLGSRYGLATAAREAGVEAALGVKGRWTHERVGAAVASGQQVLVFSDFPAALTALSQTLGAAGVANAVISSVVTARRRQVAVDAFAAGELPVLLVAATGQLGLNLQTAAYVVHLDVPTSAATLLQRTARAARIGSSHPDIRVDVPVLEGCADATLLEHLAADTPLVDLWALAAELVGDAAPAPTGTPAAASSSTGTVPRTKPGRRVREAARSAS